MSSDSLPRLLRTLPSDLAKRIQESPTFSVTIAAAFDFEQLFKLSGLPFFREYTDHSLQHSLEVIQAAGEIISPESWPVISADDLNILVLATLIHDVGLHVSEDVFLRLVHPSNTNVAIKEFDEESWPQLWLNFLSEAKRFNEKKLKDLFGDTQPIKEPSASSLDLTQRDRLLIGEFLRRHHARFAHEFALGLIDNASGGKFDFLATADRSTRDIIGLVARSHGINLRDAFSYISKYYDLRDFNRIHIVYLMVLLRIADCLQIQPARAPTLYSKIHRIKSPFSAAEWRVHQCIDNITTSSFDPEAIYVAATPDSVHDYLKLKRWLKTLQEEMDRSWAILGEVYGRFAQEHLDRLQINLRRVRSNIEDKAALQKRVEFIPEALKFSVSEPELLKLLMGPLYGEDPVYGLREMTQNSADSVKELEQLKRQNIRLEGQPLQLSSEIEIEISLAKSMFVIRDQGTGMTLEVVRNYFLRAGASFRNSEMWKKEFLDEAGKSKIARTGRFGVGALSAFLIGDKISVYSRHYTDKSGFGYRFSCMIDDDEIQIMQERGDIGTIVEISTDEERIKRIQEYLEAKANVAFYYKADFPKLTFIPPLAKESEDAKRREPNWISVKSQKYEKVSWDRNLPKQESSEGYGYLYCNGILIGNVDAPATDLILESSHRRFWEPKTPTVSIIDNNGHLPVDLARKGLARSDTELRDGILESITEEFIASIYQLEGSSPSEILNSATNSEFMYGLYEWAPLAFAAEGYLLLDQGLIEKYSPKKLFVHKSDKSSLRAKVNDPFLSGGLTAVRHTGRSSSKTSLLQQLTDTGYGTGNFPSFEGRYGSGQGLRYFLKSYVVMDKDSFDSVFELKSIPNYVWGMRSTSLTFTLDDKDCVVVDRNGPGQALAAVADFFQRALTFEEVRQRAVVLWTDFKERSNKETLFSRIWSESFSSVSLPYDKEAREKALKLGAPIIKHLK